MRRLQVAGVSLLMLLVLASPLLAQEDEPFVWPKKLSGEKGEVILYQPQVESFVGDKLESRCAVSVQMAGQTDMIFGARWF